MTDKMFRKYFNGKLLLVFGLAVYVERMTLV